MKNKLWVVLLVFLCISCDRPKSRIVDTPSSYVVYDSAIGVYGYEIENHQYLVVYQGGIIHAAHCPCGRGGK